MPPIVTKAADCYNGTGCATSCGLLQRNNRARQLAGAKKERGACPALSSLSLLDCAVVLAESHIHFIHEGIPYA